MAHPFWTTATSKRRDWSEEYQLETKYELYSKEPSSGILIKPWESVVEKTFRKNILENNSWPGEPVGKWITPENYLADFMDILRTTFVVKYLDGVDFLAKKLSDLALQYGLRSAIDRQAKDVGYYALHYTVWIPFTVPRRDWKTKTLILAVEIQITTQLQEVIKKLLHKHYEATRIDPDKSGIGWQWDYRSKEFFANYLGHILHYMEGAILEVRDKDKGHT
jgi:ppGpp synthetase/RelA/SpoT-type nucleotidyltranferase